MWGSTAGGAVGPVGGQEEARAAREPHIQDKTGTRLVGRCEHRARHRGRRCGARRPGAWAFRWEGKWKLARRASPTSRHDTDAVAVAASRPMRASAATRTRVVRGATAGRARRPPHGVNDVGRDRRARGCSGGRARRSSRGARAPHSIQDRDAVRRPMRASAATRTGPGSGIQVGPSLLASIGTGEWRWLHTNGSRSTRR